MNDTTPTTGPIEIVLRTSQWREVGRAADQLPDDYDIPGLDALLHQLSVRGLLDDVA